MSCSPVDGIRQGRVRLSAHEDKRILVGERRWIRWKCDCHLRARQWGPLKSPRSLLWTCAICRSIKLEVYVKLRPECSCSCSQQILICRRNDDTSGAEQSWLFHERRITFDRAQIKIPQSDAVKLVLLGRVAPPKAHLMHMPSHVCAVCSCAGEYARTNSSNYLNFSSLDRVWAAYGSDKEFSLAAATSSLSTFPCLRPSSHNGRRNGLRDHDR